MKDGLYTPTGIPKFWYNLVPDLENKFGLSLPPLLDPDAKDSKMSWQKLAKTLPEEMARQELGQGIYGFASHIRIPSEIMALYETWRPTPLVRAKKLEEFMGLDKVRIFFKREDTNQIGSYKLNSSYVQAHYAQKEGVKEFIGDTGPGNWGMGMAIACKEFKIPATIYMEQKNYDAKIDKVRVMERFGAQVRPIQTHEGTIASSLSVAAKHVHGSVNRDKKLSLGCLTGYSALHNTVIGLELRNQFQQQGITPYALTSVVGGGSSFSGFTFPFVKDHRDTRFVAVESTNMPSFTKGKYIYEHPDTEGLFPLSKMFTVGAKFKPESMAASGLGYHGKNPILSMLVNEHFVEAVAYADEEISGIQKLFEDIEGIKPAAESCYAIKSAMDLARQVNGEEKDIVFLLSGNGYALG